ncbi:MAG: PHP domain-containing protein [Verrucomicrobiota bacterium]
MFDYDFHIHTELCGHAPGQTIGKILAKADELGLETIAITEHVSSCEDIKKVDIIRSETQKYHTNCRVIIGAEVAAVGHAAQGPASLRPAGRLRGTGQAPQPDRPLGPPDAKRSFRLICFSIVRTINEQISRFR